MNLGSRVTQLALTTIIAMASLFAAPAKAQNADILMQMAIGSAAYEQSADQCFYGADVPAAMEAIEDRLSAYPAWQQMKDAGALQLGTLVNMGRMQDSSACRTLGIAVGQALLMGIIIVGLDEALAEDAERLMDGGGLSYEDSSEPY